MFRSSLYADAQKALAILSSIMDSPPSWYLVGGSALALHFGHRISYDLDFCTNVEIKEETRRRLLSIPSFEETLFESPHTLLGNIAGVKFSLFYYQYPLIDELLTYDGIHIAGIKDIGAMKLAAMMQRTAKRDYVDTYVIAKQYSTNMILEWFLQKYSQHAQTSSEMIYRILKSFSFFDDVESDEMPQMSMHVEWNDIKTFFSQEAARLAKKYLESNEKNC